MKITDCNGKNTPYVDGSKYHGPEETDLFNPQYTAKYQEVLDELRYIADCKRLGIKFYVNRLSRAKQKPTKRHFCILKHVLKCFKTTQHLCIIYNASNQMPNL